MPIKKCRNKCIFCFIDQLPKGLRKTLYLKDDDYLESFKHGNFITLTNLSDSDINKIIKYNLSPLYISFHSADYNIRKIIFNNNKQNIAIDYLRKLDENNIVSNIQIVVCPGINNGSDLENTLDFLNMFNNINSIGLVPVGITNYNKNKRLLSFNNILSAELIEFVEKLKKLKKMKNVYISDEFYIIAGKDIPAYEDYKDFPQIENGIGMIADFSNDFKKLSEKLLLQYCSNKKTGINKKTISNILVLTSEYSENFIYSLISWLKERIKKLSINFNLNVNIMVIKNKIFGGNVKVMGLLSFMDINENLIKIKALNNYDKIIISDIIFNSDDFTLDNKSREDFRKISDKIIFVKNNGRSLAKELLNK
ncbi:MAG: DUF512 domain-containing protein [Actinomycetota bacterium]|nr:DUF512 domain-containing protein [Actinomycetota bacterium]